MKNSIRWTLRGLALVPAFLLSGLLALRPAWAIAPPQVTIGLDRSEFPVGGVISGSVQCLPACLPSEPRFYDSSSQGVSGSFAEDVATGGRFAFVPEPSLKVGTYSISVSGGFTPATATFRVVDASFEPPSFTSRIQTTTSGGYGTLRECQTYAPDVYRWFMDQTMVRPVVSLNPSGLFAGQFLYGIVLPGETPLPLVVWPPATALDSDAAEICFEVYGFSLLDDSMIDLGSECLSTAGWELGVLDEYYGDYEGTLASCVVPPSGFEQPWCEWFEGAFVAQSCEGYLLESCFAARRACPSGDDPSQEDEQAERESIDAEGASASGGSASGESGDSGGSASAGTSAGGESDGDGSSSDTSDASDELGAPPADDAEPDDPRSMGESKGCSWRHNQTSQSPWGLLCLGLALIAWSRRTVRTWPV